jgi:hypothetical protein
MTEPPITVGYYCSTDAKEIKERFVKMLADMLIPGVWDAQTQEDAVIFANGSKVVFVYSVTCGDFNIVAPTEPISYPIGDIKIPSFVGGGIVKGPHNP